MLERLLKKLIVQETAGFFDYSIIMVDNDKLGSAKAVAENLAKLTHINIQYAIEPERSIPAARNHALRLASGNYIAIIDDDEFPPPDWLQTLYKAIQTFEVDGALGPVIAYFEEKPPLWLIKGKFCERPIYRTGTILDWYQTRTGNVLLKRKVFDEYGLRFDLKYKTSGSDRAFFKEAITHGYKFIAVAEAPVYELVPPERWKKSYYIRRAIIQGYNSYKNYISDLPFSKKIALLIKSSIASIFYLLVFPFSIIWGPALYVKCLEKGAHHFSQLLARLGIELIKNRDI